jgi:hypothetical protein
MEQMELQAEIVRTFSDAIDGEWGHGSLWFVQVGGVASAGNTVTRPDGSSQRIRLPRSILRAFSKLRQSMYLPERGAWLSAHVEVAPSGDFGFTFNYDRRVHLDGDGRDIFESVPSESDLLNGDSYLRDLETFPRAEEFIPDWYPTTALPRRISDPREYFADALSTEIVPLSFAQRLWDASPAWRLVLGGILAAVPEQIAALTDDFSAELVDPGLDAAKALWILDGPLQSVSGRVIAERIDQGGLEHLHHLYLALKALPVDQQRALEVEGLPEYPTVPAVPADATVATLYREGTVGEQLELMTQAVSDTIGRIVDNDFLQRFHVAPGGGRR